MALATQNILTDKFAFSSSLSADVWHPQKDAKAYEWWYFDALSDDGNEAIVIIFLDNFIFSPRYNKGMKDESGGMNQIVNELHPSSLGPHASTRFPAVSFTYFRDGRPLYRAVNEYSDVVFSADEQKPECRIGDSSFRFESAAYGSGYTISIKTKLSRDRSLEADFEWLSIESDFSPDAFCYKENAHCWNMVAPRSDVTGKITIFDKKGRTTDVRQFRGTGYHDHNLDNRWLAKTVREWHWGRAHFADATAVFYRYSEVADETPVTKLFVIRNGELEERNVRYVEKDYARDKFGIRYPAQLDLDSDDDVRLQVKRLKVIDSSFYYLRFLSEITLTLQDGIPRKTTGITDFLAPKALKHRWLNWLSDMRIGKNGKGPRI